MQPYEVWLLPASIEPSFEQATSPDGFDRLAERAARADRRIESIVPDAAYNLLLRTAPWIAGVRHWYHWRIELLPRVERHCRAGIGHRNLHQSALSRTRRRATSAGLAFFYSPA